MSKCTLRNCKSVSKLKIEFYWQKISTLYNIEADYRTIHEIGKKAQDSQYIISDQDIISLLIARSILNTKGNMEKDVREIILSSFVYENSDFPTIYHPIPDHYDDIIVSGEN